MTNCDRHHRSARDRGRRRTARSARRAFTLAELLIAGVITAFLVGSLTISLAQLGQTKNTSKRRFDAHLRADAALNLVRKDIVSVIRTDDLFFTRLLIEDFSDDTLFGTMDRDEILIFNTRLRPVRNTDHFNGEGQEYETQYRVSDDGTGPVLWQRRDMVPDEYPRGGGVATPTISGIIGISFEAYDGESWYQQWDSDHDGLPHAVRVTVTALGSRTGDDLYDPKTPIASLRTVVPIDRVFEPRDHAEAEEQALAEAEQQAAADAAGQNGGLDGSGAPIIDEAGAIIDPVTGAPIGNVPGGAGGGGGGAGSTPGRPGGGGGTTPRPGSPNTGSGSSPNIGGGGGRPPSSVDQPSGSNEAPVIPPE